MSSDFGAGASLSRDNNGVGTIAAARHFGVTPRTLQRWAASGCPHDIRGKRQLVFDVAAVEAWRQSDVLSAVAHALFDVWLRDGGDGCPAWRSLRLPEAETIALLLLAYERIARALDAEPEPLPAVLRQSMSRLVYLRQDNVRIEHGNRL